MKKHFFNICLALIILIFNSCTSNKQNKTEASQKLEYRSINYPIKFNYTKETEIFESTEVILFSDRVDTLIAAEKDRLKFPGFFITTLTITNNELLITFFNNTSNAFKIPELDLSLFKKDRSININTFLNAGFITQEDFEKLKLNFYDIFTNKIGPDSIFIKNKDSFLLANTIKEEKDPINYIYLIRLINPELVAVMEIKYNTNFADSLTLNKMVNILQSIKLANDLDSKLPQ